MGTQSAGFVIMDKMDIDHIVDVPDTPDTLTTRRFLKSGSDNENHRQTIPIYSEQQKFVEKVTQNRPMNIENGKKRLLLRLPKSTSSSSNSLHPKNITVNLTDRIKHRPEARNSPGLENGPSSHFPKKISTPVQNSSEGTNNMSIVGSSSMVGNGNREGIEFLGLAQRNPGNNRFVPLDSSASPRINRQKRLVRNGCISPNNISKAKEFSGKETNGSVAVVQNNNASLGSSAQPVSIDIMDLVADDNNSYKGKGKAVVYQPCSSKELDAKNKQCLGRSSLSINNKPKETNGYNKGVGTSIEGDGWISTHRPRNTNLPVSDDDQVIGLEMNEPKYAHQPHHTRTGKSEKGISIQTSGDFTKNPKMPSSDHSVISQPLNQPKSNPRLTTRVRRRMPESASSSFNECYISVRDDPEIMFISSPREPSTSRTTSRRVNNLQPAIEVDEFSPELRNNRANEDARVRQFEADERLARQLQEQFYNETPAFGTEEFDQHIAMALQHQDDGLAPLPRRSTRPVSNARGPRPLNVIREPQLRSSDVPRRGSHTRAAALGRMARRRSQFPGEARTTLPTAGSTSLFPPNMDIDMRMHILGALETFSDTGAGHRLLQTQRDFNENDYEMLLALDDNFECVGASAHVINGLPQSTVQSTTYDETCAICLETPTIGDTIRHLPCLHKFHKDCIDPWLRRKTSCPVCKSSVT